MITRQRLSDHITPTLQQLHWLPVKQRIVFKVLTLTYKALSGECPAYLADLINVQQTGRTGLIIYVLVIEKHYLKGDAEGSGGSHFPGSGTTSMECTSPGTEGVPISTDFQKESKNISV